MKAGNAQRSEPLGQRRSWGRPGPWLGLLWLLLLPAIAAAQESTEEVEAAVTALPHIRKSLPAGTAALDPEAFCRARLVGWDCPAALQNAADELGFRLNSRAFVHVCLGGAGKCRLVGAESLVVFEAPRVQRNTATLNARIWWRTDGEAGSLSQRRIRLSLAKRANRWEVVRQRTLPD